MSQKAHSASRGPRPTARDLSRWPRKREFNSRYSRDVGVCKGHSPRLRSPGDWFGSLQHHTTSTNAYVQYTVFQKTRCPTFCNCTLLQAAPNVQQFLNVVNSWLVKLKFHWDQFPRNFPVANVTGKSLTSYEEVSGVSGVSPACYEEVTKKLATFRPSRHVKMVWRVANSLVTSR